VDSNQAAEAGADLEFIVQGAKAGQKLELRLWLRLFSTTRLISQEIRRRLRAEFDTTLPQFDLLSQLFREPGGLRLGELSKRTMVTNGNVTGLTDRLEADGLLIRETVEGDRRVTVAKLSKRGRETFAAMAKAHEGWLKELLRDVEPENVTRLLAHLAEVKRSASVRIAESDV
jgi:DNA-binding MarR family transcriptional regulator